MPDLVGTHTYAGINLDPAVYLSQVKGHVDTSGGVLAGGGRIVAVLECALRPIHRRNP